LSTLVSLLADTQDLGLLTLNSKPWDILVLLPDLFVAVQSSYKIIVLIVVHRGVCKNMVLLTLDELRYKIV